MPRTLGSRGADYEGKRAALVAKLKARLAQPGDTRPSLREMAAAAGVGVATLKHYFGSRDGAVEAVFSDYLAGGQPHLERARQPQGTFAESVREFLDYMAGGVRHAGLGDVFAVGSIEGLMNPDLGPAYLDNVLEPSVQALSQRLSAHQERGEMRAGNPRHAALALISPLVLALQHQFHFYGAERHPLDLDAFIGDLADGFVRAYQA